MIRPLKVYLSLAYWLWGAWALASHCDDTTNVRSGFSLITEHHITTYNIQNLGWTLCRFLGHTAWLALRWVRVLTLYAHTSDNSCKSEASAITKQHVSRDIELIVSRVPVVRDGGSAGA